MASWTWDLPCSNGTYASIEHDGRVLITVADEEVDNDRVAVVDQYDFEAMCRSYLGRMNEWRARTGDNKVAR